MRLYRRVMIAVLAVAMTLAAAPAFAQTAQQRPAPKPQVNSGFGFGALGGFTWSSLSTSSNVNTGGKAGYVFGLWFGGNRDSRAGLGAELNYMTKQVTIANVDQKLQYVQVFVPFDVRFGYREKNKPNGYIVVGPNFDININTSQGGNSVDDVYQGLGLGLTVGAGVEAARVGGEVRYSFGLKNALQTDGNLAALGDSKFNTLSFVVKLRIN